MIRRLAVCVTVVLLSGCPKPPPEMVLIPGGPFLIGTDEVDSDQEAMEAGLPRPWYEDEHPLRKVYLPDFYIDRHEVTNARYHEFVTATGRRRPENWIGGSYPPERARFPVVFVDWFEADAYCRWLGKRLPTEAEWEKAARGPHGFKYPWGNEFDPARANIAQAAVMAADSRPVGQYEGGKSPYGVYDMTGNVWEWTDSLYDPYPGNTAQNENFGRGFRVTRGLSFMTIGHFPPDVYQRVASIVARTSFRSYDFPTSRLADVGFRCAKSAS